MRTDKLSKTYRRGWFGREVVALREVELAVPHGERLALMGHNGAGKSTLLYLLIGLIHPSSGTMDVFGGTPSQVNIRARIGFLPERPALPAMSTPSRWLDLCAKLHGLASGPATARREELLEQLSLSNVRDRAIGALSHGTRQRLALAQALLHQPDLTLLDEPETGLDAASVAVLHALLDSLQQQGKTVILTGHQPVGLLATCSRIAVMEDGAVTSWQTP